MKHAHTILKGLVLLLLVFGFVGCDTLEDLNPFNNEKEVSGIVEAIGSNSLTVDGIEYRVTSDTEFEGISGLSDLSVGDEVEIEYEEDGGTRTAVEIELAGADDDD
jgi:hypothetical protein